ncbi:nucleotidyltransferase family protein [Adlercreutzia sp. ZJ242]|uniref:nucleotidyltransferase family protein n=1 Tax=Adlercreutzia sp. ZJ242 TaxID=2709409 RepID=UPI0013EA8F30|nr:nucleotidyltransferase domain-containing protein [Adlercreutzia sp. ZJ242]
MTQSTLARPQTVRISSKRQITIPSKLYKKKGFAEYAWVEETEEGLLLKPINVEDGDVSLFVLRQLVAAGYEGEELVKRYQEACPRVVGLQPLAVEKILVSSGERVREAVAQAAAAFPAIRKAYLFGSFARGTFNDESDVDVRIEYDADGSFSLRELAQFQKRIEQATGREVDVVSAKRLKNRNLEAAIEREKVLVYEREEQ